MLLYICVIGWLRGREADLSRGDSHPLELKQAPDPQPMPVFVDVLDSPPPLKDANCPSNALDFKEEAEEKVSDTSGVVDRPGVDDGAHQKGDGMEDVSGLLKVCALCKTHGAAGSVYVPGCAFKLLVDQLAAKSMSCLSWEIYCTHGFG